MTPTILMTLTFVVSAFIAFFTGTSWGTYAIVTPICVQMALNISGGALTPVVYAAIAAVMGGGCFGDHCSPLSDTTILSSLATGSDHIDHVTTFFNFLLFIFPKCIIFGKSMIFCIRSIVFDKFFIMSYLKLRSRKIIRNGENGMKLLKLVIVDDEPILLQGLVKTYNWNEMGFEVAGQAQSGEQAIEVIKKVKPHVVLTDIRMKQVSGLMVMEEIQKTELDPVFIVLSAYRDFNYAQQACDLGAYAYLLKPIEEDKLQETMQGAYQTCMEKLESEERYESWENMIRKDSTSFLQVVVQKYLQNKISYEKVQEVFAILKDVIEEGDRFIAMCVDLDLTYKITDALNYEAARLELIQSLEEMFSERYFFWHFEKAEGCHVFLIKTKENATVREIAQILEQVKGEQKSPVTASISKPYKGLDGIRRSYEEAQGLFEPICSNATNENTFPIPVKKEEKAAKSDCEEAGLTIVNAVRKNTFKELKQAFIVLIYALPHEEELQIRYIHKVMLQAEMMLNDTYGMTEKLQKQFRNYYSNMESLTAAQAVDVSYRILGEAIEEREKYAESGENKCAKEYMTVALSYIGEHLQEEELSIVQVATQIYLNPVYFGRVFKNTFHMTFKKYLLQQRMEKAKRLIQDGCESIGTVCEQVGISNASYFSHLFKEYTGKLPSEYKKDYEE